LATVFLATIALLATGFLATGFLATVVVFVADFVAVLGAVFVVVFVVAGALAVPGLVAARAGTATTRLRITVLPRATRIRRGRLIRRTLGVTNG
jgi:hypothetical protein